MTETEIPKTHKAVVFDNPGTLSLKIQDVETPEPGPNQVLVRLTHSGVCHSDYGIMMRTWSTLPYPTPPNQVGGHEGVGKIVKLGPGVEKGQLKIGDRVGIKWISDSCGGCPPCLEGMEAGCFNVKVSGYFTPGTFQQYIIGPAHYVTPIPEGLPSDIAAPMLCAGLTVYTALKRSKAQPGDFVVISGAGGGLGHLACQIGSHGFGYRIIGIDSDEKEEFVKECGAEAFIGLNQFSRDAEGDKALAAAVKKPTTGGLGAAAVLVCVGSNAAYAQAVHFMRPFSCTLVAVGMPEGPLVPISTVNPNWLVKNTMTVTASAVGNRREAAEVLNLITSPALNIRPKFTTHTMDELASGEIFRKMEKGQLLGRAVVVLD